MASKLLILTLCALTPSWAALSHTRSFDYVIVGGGTAGLTVANRLSEDPDTTVAVIEAGRFIEDVAGNLSQVPAYVSQLLAETRVNNAVGWGFKTTPQSGIGGKVVDYVRAKVLGGCSSINNMAYSYTSKGALQYLADTVGDQSYTWDHILPYYRKSMDFTPPDDDTRFANATPSYDVSQTAEGGPLDVSYPAYAESWSTWASKGLAAVGIASRGALIEGGLTGAAWQLLTVNHDTGYRASSATAFLNPYLRRPNLAVFTETLAERVLFDDDKVATGVKVNCHGSEITLHANKEVILSAGVFQSPQLLMVSGVGPAVTLQQYDIPIVADRPGVGKGMRDHIFVPLTYQISLAGPDINSASAVQAFNDHARGPLTNPGGDIVGLEKIPESFRADWSSRSKDDLDALPSDWPEIQYLFLPSAVTGGTTAGASYGTVFATLQAPQSKGNVSIASAYMSDPPVINPNWLTSQTDIDVLLAGFKRARQLIKSDVMADIIVGDEFLPGPGVQTDEQILAYFQLAATCLCHAHATNAMGQATDPNAVVSTTGKVYGVEKLRVIDASTFPFLLPGPGPQAHVYMLAEKLADAIKDDQ